MSVQSHEMSELLSIATEPLVFQPSLVTVEGGTKVGKGTGAVGTSQRLSAEGFDPYVIDQGQKFRMFALETKEFGIDVSSVADLEAYLNDPETQQRILERLGDDPARLKNLLDTDDLGTGARIISPNEVAQEVAKKLMARQIEAAQSKDVIILDGRSMEAKARELQARGLGRYVVGFFVRCDSSVAAMRQAGIDKPFEAMNEDERARFWAALISIHNRNASDATRDIHPVVSPVHSVSVDITRFDGDAVPEFHMYSMDTTYSKRQQLISAMSSLTLRAVQNSQVAPELEFSAANR